MHVQIKSKLEPIDWLKMFRAHRIEVSCATPPIHLIGDVSFDDTKKVVTIKNKDNYCKLDYNKLTNINIHGIKGMTCKYGSTVLMFIARG